MNAVKKDSITLSCLHSDFLLCLCWKSLAERISNENLLLDLFWSIITVYFQLMRMYVSFDNIWILHLSHQCNQEIIRSWLICPYVFDVNFLHSVFDVLNSSLVLKYLLHPCRDSLPVNHHFLEIIRSYTSASNDVQTNYRRYPIFSDEI